MAQARTLYAEEDLGLELSNTMYALDSTMIDLCLSLFPWAPFRATKAAVKIHTLLDLRGNIPSFIHVSDGKWHDVNVLDRMIPEPAAIYVMDRACLDLETALRTGSSRRVLCHTGQVEYQPPARLFGTERSSPRHYLRSDGSTNGFLQSTELPRSSAAHSLPRYRNEPDPGVSNQSVRPSACDNLRSVQGTLESGIIFQMDQAAPAYQEVLRHLRKCRESTNLGGRVRLLAGRHRQKTIEPGGFALHFVTDLIAHAIRENPVKQGTFPNRVHF